MVFAKEFFEMIDEFGSGEISLEQIQKPLAILGLSTNLQFLAIAFGVYGLPESETKIH